MPWRKPWAATACCETAMGFEFAGQVSYLSFYVQGRFSGWMPLDGQPISSTWLWLRLAGPLRSEKAIS
jgi:hypothetical protein